MFKRFIIIVFAFFLFSCETNQESKEDFSHYLLILNQGNSSGSYLSQIDLDNDKTLNDAYGEHNEGASIGVYGNDMIQHQQLIFIAIAGSAGASSIRVLDTNLKSLSKISSPSSELSAQRIAAIGNKLAVIYANWTTYQHQLVIYDISETKIKNNNVNILHQSNVSSTSEIIASGSDFYHLSGNNLNKVSSVDYSSTSMTIPSSHADIAFFNNQIYISFTDYRYSGIDGDNTRSRTPQGRIYIIQPNLTISDSIVSHRGIDKLIVSDSQLFALSITGEQTGSKISWGDGPYDYYYSWNSLNKKSQMNRIQAGNLDSLFQNETMNTVSESDWVRFERLKNGQFVIPSYSNFSSNGEVAFLNSNGSLAKKITVSIGPCQFLEIQN